MQELDRKTQLVQLQHDLEMERIRVKSEEIKKSGERKIARFREYNENMKGGKY